MTTRKPPRRIRRRETLTIDGVIGQHAGKGGGTVLAVLARVGQAAFVPPGYELADCSDCRSAVWINPDLVTSARRRGLELVCLCVSCAGL